jgi:hypothetical protein
MKPSLIYGVFSLLLYIVIAWQYRKINKAIFFTPLIIQILTFTISFFTVIHLFLENYILEETFLLLILQFLMYFFTFMMLPHVISNRYSELKNFVNIRPFDFKFATVIFYISLFTALIYIILFWTLYSEGSDRLYFNRDFRSLSLLNTLFSTWCLSLSSIIYSKNKNKKFLFYIFITIVLLLFMGSKGIAIVGIFIFLFFYLQYNKLNIKYIFISGMIILIAVIVPTQIMYGNALEVIIDRIMMSGDIYLFSFVIGDYRELIGFYDTLKYFLHPFSSLFGIRGYDFPLGAQILSTANIPVTGVGPQDHMSILALTFFPDSYLAIFIFTIYICLIIFLFMILNFYIFSLTKIHITLRSVIFILIYTQIINIFVGINAFSFNIILIVLSILTYFLFLFIDTIFSTKRSGIV